MPERSVAGARNAPAAGESPEALAIDLAILHMECRGWIDEPSEQVIDDLRRLYHEHAEARKPMHFSGEVLYDALAARPAEYLAGQWLIEQEEHWQRHEAPRWSCPCGVVFGAYEFALGATPTMFTLATDGLFDTPVTDCPTCGRNLAKVQADQLDGQLGFAF